MKQERIRNGRCNRVARLEKPDGLSEARDFSHEFFTTLILGEKFAFVGSTYSIPLSSWRNSSVETFDSDGTMSNIPSNVADVYSKM